MPHPRKLEIAEVGAFTRRSPEDKVRRTAALIEILEADEDFAALPKKFHAINLEEGRDFLRETDTYDVVILHSILSPGIHIKPTGRHARELRVSTKHTIEAWKERLLETDARYIIVAEGQPYTLSGWMLGELPGYRILKMDRWVAVYGKEE